jgi:hypothetical protein
VRRFDKSRIEQNPNARSRFNDNSVLSLNFVCRGSSITSGFLILVLAFSAFGCATGLVGESLASCHRPNSQRRLVGSTSAATAAASPRCKPTLKSSQGRCSLRSLERFQFAELRNFEIQSPLQLASGKASPPVSSRIIVSSIGSPETDRGPPHS